MMVIMILGQNSPFIRCITLLGNEGQKKGCRKSERQRVGKGGKRLKMLQRRTHTSGAKDHWSTNMNT